MLPFDIGVMSIFGKACEKDHYYVHSVLFPKSGLDWKSKK